MPKGLQGFQKGGSSWNKGKKGVMPIPWNKGKRYHTGKPSGMLGKHHTEESKMNIGLGAKGNKYALGYKHTDEWKKIMSEKTRGRDKGISKPMKCAGWNKGLKMS